MPKPPTELRGRRPQSSAPPPAPPSRRRFLRERPTTRLDAPGEPVTRFWTARKILILAASIAGLCVSTYLTIAHYSTAITVSCPNTGAINCLKVTTSPQSIVFGIPVAVLGLVFFVSMLALSLPVAWRSPVRYVAWARLGMAVTGIGFVFYLVYSELYTIHAICLWCSSVHILTLLIFALVVTGWGEATAPWYAEDETDLAPV
jgi:uncharacterized membrane protein